MIFQAGSCRFTILSSEAGLVEKLQRCFVQAKQPSQLPILEIDLADKFSEAEIGLALRQIVCAVVSSHGVTLYVEGVAMRNHFDETVLLVGVSRAGKSTLAASLALAHGWDIISEDLVIFDESHERIVPLYLPISLRPDAPNLIEEATGVHLNILGQQDFWTVIEHRKFRGTLAAKFKKVMILERADEAKLVCESLPVETALRQMLPATNALYFPNGIDALMKMIGSSVPYRLTGGSLKDRILTMLSL